MFIPSKYINKNELMVNCSRGDELTTCSFIRKIFQGKFSPSGSVSIWRPRQVSEVEITEPVPGTYMVGWLVR